MKNKFSIAMTLAVVLAMLLTSLALADNVVNDVTVGGSDTFIAGGSTIVGYKVVANKDTGESPPATCNVTDGTTAQVNINTPAGVTASPNAITFSQCNVFQNVTFSSSTPGNYVITVSITDNGADEYNLTPATFTLHVQSAPPPSDGNATVSGLVLETDGVTPISGATVSCTISSGCNANLSTTTDASGIYSFSGGNKITFAGTSATVTLTATKTGYNSGSSTFSVTNGGTYAIDLILAIIDSTAPVITPNVSGTLGSNGWYTSDVTLTWTVTDPESTVTIDDGCEDQNITADQFATDYSCSASSDGGSAGPVTVSIKRDATAPSISADAGSYVADTWTNQNVTVHYACSDGGSDVASVTGDQTFNTDGVTLSTSGTCTDNAGNSASANFGPIKIDKTAPSISASATKADSSSYTADSWTNQDVTVHYACSDGGSGVASVTGDQLFDDEGVTASTDGTCTDNAGNSSIASFGPIKIDKTAPTIVASISPADSSTGWYNLSTGEPTVSFTCNDTGGSDLAGSCPSAVTLSEGADQSVSGGPVSDLAGNVSNVATISNIDVDLTAPSLSPSVSPNPVVLNGSATASPNASDALSGLASASCGTVVTSSVGSFAVNCTATDNAGNSANANASYTVSYAVCALYDQSKSHKLGSTVPVKLQLCDVNGVNQSSASIVVKAISLVKVDPTASAAVDDSGAANSPDMNFRYDPTLGGSGGGYIFNLSTKGLSKGTWKMIFTVGSDLTQYTVQFDVK